MHSVYIIYSKSLNQYYIGQTEDIEVRLEQHNTGYYHTSFTSKTSDWVLYLKVACDSKAQAISIEFHIKRMKSRKYIKNLKQYPEIAKKLLSKYS